MRTGTKKRIEKWNIKAVLMCLNKFLNTFVIFSGSVYGQISINLVAEFNNWPPRRWQFKVPVIGDLIYDTLYNKSRLQMFEPGNAI